MHPDNYSGYFDPKNSKSGLKMKFLKFLGIQPSYGLCLGRSGRIPIHVLRIIDAKN